MQVQADSVTPAPTVINNTDSNGNPRHINNDKDWVTSNRPPLINVLFAHRHLDIKVKHQSDLHLKAPKASAHHLHAMRISNSNVDNIPNVVEVQLVNMANRKQGPGYP